MVSWLLLGSVTGSQLLTDRAIKGAILTNRSVWWEVEGTAALEKLLGAKMNRPSTTANKPATSAALDFNLNMVVLISPLIFHLIRTSLFVILIIVLMMMKRKTKIGRLKLVTGQTH